MAEHSTSVELFYDGDWHTVTARTGSPINLSQGAGSEGQEAPPSSATATLDNTSGDYNPKNPTSPLYGLVGRNTPMRVSTDGSVRSTTEVSSWAPQRAIKGNARTPVVGGGLLRRLGQGKSPLKSSLDRAIRASNPVAYWPLNDGKGATALLSGLDGGSPLALYGARPGAVEGPVPGDASFVDVAGGLDFVSARGPAPSLPTAGWGVEFMFYIGDRNDPAEQTEQTVLLWTVGSNQWKVNVTYNPFSATPPAVLIFDDDGGVAFVGDSDTVTTGWNHARVTYEQVGGNVEVELYVNGANTSSYSAAGTLASTTGDVIVGQVAPPLIYEFTFAQASVGYLAFYALADAADHSDAAFGYEGELAEDRFARLATEEGISATVTGTVGDSKAMGPQAVDTLLNLLRECVRTDDGLLYDDRSAVGLVFRMGRDLYNQDPALTLDFTGNQIAPELQPLLDDQNTRNDVKAVRRNGSSAQAIKTTGPLNVSDPFDDPEGVGRYSVQVDVNPSTDEVLIDHAHWHLHKGTVDEVRFAQITVDLDAIGITSTLLAQVNAVTIGDVIAIDNLPTDWLPGQARQLVIGIKDALPPKRRLVTFITMPASVYEVGLVGANDGSTNLRGQAVDTDNSTLASDVSRYATTLSVASTGGVTWTTDSNDWNTSRNGGGLYIVIGGEDMRVTNISGASSPQTFTVERSTNGVVKAHSAGAPVHVRYPIRVGL